ncbi:MAG: WecB/TagA/CpsF family glycosyltransferase [Candidatus Bipolaricaulota bacterium]|nr:WecB/TagA/CpsF family glycosyltransferase [Candidatus Bipolaricaulota bacterium]
MTTKLVRQRGVLHLIAVIPLSLFLFVLFDPKLWGAAAGAALVTGTATLARRWWLQLVGLLLAALLAYSAGYRIEFITNPEGGFFYLTQWSWLITLGWIIAISQGVAVLGQLDPSGKLLTKVLVISGSALVLISLWQGQLLGVLILLALLVLVLGLRASRVPTERWSRAVGYGLALAAIVGLVKATASVALLAPVIALGLPFTGTLSIVYSHRLHLWRERPWMLSLLYLCSAYVSVLAFLATRLELGALAWVGGATAMGAGLLAWALVRLPQTAVTAKKFVLFGTPIDCVTLDGAVQKIESHLSVNREGRSEGVPALVCTPDTTAILRAQRDPRLRAVYERADLVTPDGMGIVWAGRLLGAPVPERVSGIDLVEKLFASRRAPLRVFLLGAAPGVADQAARKLTERYPTLQIVGTHHGYFGESEHVLGLIHQAQPDVVLVGLGVPRQELWMLENRPKLKASVLIGVGGCFDVWAGRLTRAPLRWQRLGLEWFYRVLQEPKRLGRVSAIPVFLGQISLAKLAQIFAE